MKITDALLGEHGVLYRLLDYCAEEADGWDAETVQAAAGALAAALKSHAQIEERLLFQALDPHLPPGMGPLAVMRSEHDEIESSVERVVHGVGADEGRELLGRIAGLAHEHFAKEEQVLFPLAEERLGAGQLEEIGARWAEERGVTIGSPMGV